MLLTPAQLLSPVDRLDWLMLSYARVAVRFGAQHSSYIKTATVAGCGVKIHESPSSWRFKSASTWLLGKVELALRGARRRNQTQESNAWSRRRCQQRRIGAIRASARCSSKLRVAHRVCLFVGPRFMPPTRDRHLRRVEIGPTATRRRRSCQSLALSCRAPRARSTDRTETVCRTERPAAVPGPRPADEKKCKFF